MTDWSVAVFVRNEELTIARRIYAIIDELRGRDASITVLINGSSDGSVNQVRRIARGTSFLQAYKIEFGDKANAWNAFIHRMRPSASCHFFVDGYAAVTKGSLELLSKTLTNTGAVAATGIPTVGTITPRTVAHMKQQGAGFQGSLRCAGRLLSKSPDAQFSYPSGHTG
jgi:hypothetical protein